MAGAPCPERAVPWATPLQHAAPPTAVTSSQHPAPLSPSLPESVVYGELVPRYPRFELLNPLAAPSPLRCGD